MNSASLLAKDVAACRLQYLAGLTACRHGMTARRVHRSRAEARRLQVRLILAEVARRGASDGRAIRTVTRQMHALGSLRDIQVQMKCLRGMASRTPGLDRLLKNLKRHERHQAKVTAKRLKAQHLDKRIRAVEALLGTSPRNAVAERRSRIRLASVLSSAHRRAMKLWVQASSGSEKLHRARIALKRYVLMREVFPPRADSTRAARELGHITQGMALLGKVHDLDVLLARENEWSRKLGLGAVAASALRIRLVRRRAHIMALRSHRVFGLQNVRPRASARANGIPASINPSRRLRAQNDNR